MVDLRAELSGPNIRRLRAPVSGSMYLLALSRELTARIEPRLSDSRDRHVLSLCRKVLVRMAYADSISLDPDGTAPREIPPAVGANRAQIREDIGRLEELGLDAAAEIAEREGRLLDAAEAQVQGDLERLAALQVAGDELRVDPQSVREYLARREGESDRLDLASFEVAPGGYSKQTLLVGVAESRLLPDTFVIRKDHPAAIMQTSVCHEYPVLVRLYEAGLQVPRPLFLESSGEYLGAPFRRLLGWPVASKARTSSRRRITASRSSWRRSSGACMRWSAAALRACCLPRRRRRLMYYGRRSSCCGATGASSHTRRVRRSRWRSPGWTRTWTASSPARRYCTATSGFTIC